MRVEFGDCAVDSETREVFRAGSPVHFSPKAFGLLELLLEKRPKALSKAEIHEKIWPDAFVSEATLTSLVAEIRAALGEGAKDARYIRTVHGFGYAFSAAVAPTPLRADLPNEACWRLFWNEREIPLPEGETIVGRDPSTGVRIPSDSVSRRHARIAVRNGAATLEDLGSKNGTYCGDARVSAALGLKDGDSIRIGPALLTVRAPSGNESTRTEIETPAKRASSPERPRRKGKRGTP